MPRIGKPLAYWVRCLEACQPVLEAPGAELEGRDLEVIVFPHVLSDHSTPASGLRSFASTWTMLRTNVLNVTLLAAGTRAAQTQDPESVRTQILTTRRYGALGAAD